MGWCSDPLVEELKRYGWNAVRMPRHDLSPLELLYWGGGRLERFGQLAEVFVAGTVPLPGVERDGAAPQELKARHTGRVRSGLGLTVLGEWLGLLGGNTIGLSAHYGSARALVFEFHNPLIDRITPAALDQFLGSADVNPFSRHASTLLERDLLYVVVETIKTPEFTVELFGEGGKAVALDAAAVGQAVGGKVEVKQNAESAGRLTYRGNVPLVFGFKAVRVYHHNGKYTAIKPVSGVELKGPLDVPQDGATYLTDDATFTPIG
jgi:hypothetical protein